MIGYNNYVTKSQKKDCYVDKFPLYNMRTLIKLIGLKISSYEK